LAPSRACPAAEVPAVAAMTNFAARSKEDAGKLQELILSHSACVTQLYNSICSVIVGQTYMIERLLVGLLANGHILLEGAPGLAKTLTVKTLAQAINTKFQRIQFTPDLLPSDIIGTLIYNQKTGEFVTQKGPIFANIILADEINRAPAKVQSALLEAMQERQVTIGGQTYPLDEPFLVLATQNPIEQEGTYPLPEAQVDRFMFKLLINYPSRMEELEIMERMAGVGDTFVEPAVTADQILATREVVRRIYIDDNIKTYIVNIVDSTRHPEQYRLNLKHLLMFGSSPRATLVLNMTARARAFMQGRAFVIPEDVKAVAPDVLRHRLYLTYEADAEHITPDHIVRYILDTLEVP